MYFCWSNTEGREVKTIDFRDGAEARLEQAGKILLGAGWTQEGDGLWKAPKEFLLKLQQTAPQLAVPLEVAEAITLQLNLDAKIVSIKRRLAPAGNA